MFDIYKPPHECERVLVAETIFVDTVDAQTSVAEVTLFGKGDRVVNHRSHMRYDIEHGQGTFIVGAEIFYVTPGDTVLIPAGIPYQDQGDMVMRVESRPPFDPSDVEILA